MSKMATVITVYVQAVCRLLQITVHLIERFKPVRKERTMSAKGSILFKNLTADRPNRQRSDICPLLH